MTNITAHEQIVENLRTTSQQPTLLHEKMSAAIAGLNLVVLDQVPLLAKQNRYGQFLDRPELDGEFGMRHPHACTP